MPRPSLARALLLVLLLFASRAASAQLIAHWELDGDLIDVEGGFDGVFSGAAEPAFGPGYDGTPSGAIFLDGVDDFVEIVDEFSELTLFDRFTLALWFRPASLDQSQKYLLSRNGGGGQYAIIWEYDDNQVDFFAPSRAFGDDPRADGLSLMPIDDTGWHHIAYTYDGGTWSGYLDGELIFEAEISFALDDAFVSNWYIGSAHATAAHVAGAIDDVRIYDDALDDEEIEELAEGAVEVECPAEGDTVCEGLELTSPAEGDVAGTWTATSTASDESGDEISYIFVATDLAGARTVTVGPTNSPTAELALGVGTWTVTVTVDDDPFCDDEAPDATCSTEVVVEPAPPKLVAHWPFDGDLADVEGGHDGTFFGDLEPLFAEGWDGTEDGAIDLDGIDDFVEVLEAPELKLTSTFSMALWFRPTSVDQSQKYLLSKNGGGGQYAIIYEYTDDRVDFFAPSRNAGDDPRAGAQSEMPITDTEWHHIAYTYDGVTWSGYIDGLQVFSTEIFFELSDAFTSNWYIGAANPNVNYVWGALDDVRIYNYGLSAEEVLELAGGETVECPETGDTRVTSLDVVGPEGGGPGFWDVFAEAEDDSGDEITYTFRALRGDTAVLTVGPQIEDSASFELGAGDWEISVTVDDDPLCPDTLPEATDSVAISTRGEDRLVAHWTFDGDTFDSASVNDGLFIGDVEPIFVEGYDGEDEGAIRLDGVDDYVEVLDAPELRLTDRFTMALWFKSASVDQVQKYLLSKNGGGGQYAIIFEYTEDHLDFFAPSRLYGPDPRADGLSEMLLADTEWHHIAYTNDGSTWRGYLDGEVLVEADIAFALSDTFFSNWYIGAANPTANFTGGDFDDVRVYNYALSPAAVAELAGGEVIEGSRFVRGDADANGSLNITDGIYILNYLFLGQGEPTCLDGLDANDSGDLNLTDGVAVLSFLFTGGPPPSAPHPQCGTDPDGDEDGVTCVESHAAGACAN